MKIITRYPLYVFIHDEMILDFFDMRQSNKDDTAYLHVANYNGSYGSLGLELAIFEDSCVDILQMAQVFIKSHQ